METIEYRTIDKSGWSNGPWVNEPDKRQFVDAATGLPCLIVRGPSGALCGYVGVDESHPWHGIDYSGCMQQPRCEDTYCEHSPDCHIEVHGGLTFADACRPSDDESQGICHKPGEGEPDHVWWFGFDCAHYRDFCPKYESGYPSDDQRYRDIEYVTAEIARLAEQLAAVSPQTDKE